MTRSLARFKENSPALNVLWAASFVVALAMLVLAVPAHIQFLTADPYALGTGLGELGLSMRGFAVYDAVLSAFVLGALILTGALVFWAKPGDRAALIASLTLLLMGLPMLPFTASLYQVNPGLYVPVQIPRLAGAVMILVFFYTFPGGRFVPAWTRFFVPAFLVFGLSIFLPGYETTASLPEVDTPFEYLSQALSLLWFGTGLYAQIFRYRRVSSAVERQQTKWVMLGLISTMVTILMLFLARVLFPGLRSGRNLALYTLVDFSFSSFAILFIPMAITFSIFRYRLWDIDLIIRRTLVYSLLSGSLALVYLMSVILLQQLFPTDSPFAIVLSTLAIAALFNPLRVRIQRAIDRRFFRRKYDAGQILAQFSRSVRDEVDLDELAADLQGVIAEIFQPERVSLWLRPGRRPLATPLERRLAGKK